MDGFYRFCEKVENELLVSQFGVFSHPSFQYVSCLCNHVTYECTLLAFLGVSLCLCQ